MQQIIRIFSLVTTFIGIIISSTFSQNLKNKEWTGRLKDGYILTKDSLDDNY